MIDSTGPFQAQKMSSTYLRHDNMGEEVVVSLKQIIFQSRHEHLSDEGAQWRSNRDSNVGGKSIDGIIKLTYVGSKALIEEGFKLRYQRKGHIGLTKSSMMQATIGSMET